MSHGTHMNESRHRYEWVTARQSPTSIHGTHMNGPWVIMKFHHQLYACHVVFSFICVPCLIRRFILCVPCLIRRFIHMSHYISQDIWVVLYTSLWNSIISYMCAMFHSHSNVCQVSFSFICVPCLILIHVCQVSFWFICVPCLILIHMCAMSHSHVHSYELLLDRPTQWLIWMNFRMSHITYVIIILVMTHVTTYTLWLRTRVIMTYILFLILGFIHMSHSTSPDT